MYLKKTGPGFLRWVRLNPGFGESLNYKPVFIVSDICIVSVTEFFVTRLGSKDRTQFHWDDQVASDVRIV